MVIESATTGPKRWYTRIDVRTGSDRASRCSRAGPAPAGASEAFGEAATSATPATSANHNRVCGRIQAVSLEVYWFKWSSAYCIGTLETLITPSNGPSSSRMRKTAAATEIAAMHSTETTVAFRGA